jgi:DNA-directed RNA polymerase specialized sigma24 family protein
MALSRLPARQAEAIKLIYSRHATQAEVAKQLGSTVEEVKRLIATGLQNLSAQLT